jgi:leucine dehydrogenase
MSTAVSDHPEFDAHERVLFAHDQASGLKAIIAVHSSTLGPGAGGVRMQPYASAEAAVADVLRLSRGMSLKNALAGLPLGGGKAVIIADPKTDKTPGLLAAFGQAVHGLGGQYLTAEDVGMGMADMESIARETPYVFGRPDDGAGTGAFGGDPSPFTALGVFLSMQVTARHGLGRDSLRGLTVAVQGAGAVGGHLCRMLGEAGSRVIVADADPARAQAAADACGGRSVPAQAILTEAADILAPCALGAVLDDDTIPGLRVQAICGAANNQLAEARHGRALAARGILYAPDYVANAGGIINVAHEVRGSYDPAAVNAHVARIPGTLDAIFIEATRSGDTPDAVADRKALALIGRQA